MDQNENRLARVSRGMPRTLRLRRRNVVTPYTAHEAVKALRGYPSELNPLKGYTMKRILPIAIALFATIGAAQAQQQTGILASQIPLRGAGQGSTFDAATARYINFAQNDPYIIDADGIRVNGSFSLSKLQAMPAWKGYIKVTDYLYINTVGARFSCNPGTNYATLINFAGHGSEARADNCSLRDRVNSQSDTN